jgi:hypothetical protein
MRLITILAIIGSVTLLASPAPAADFDVDRNPILGDTVRPDNEAGQPAAGVMTFDNQADFLAAAGAVTTEDFEDEPVVGDCSTGGVSNLSVTDFSVASSVPALKLLNIPCFGNHNTTPGGAQYLSMDTDVGGVGADIMIVLDNPSTAFGLYLIDLESASIEVVINGSSYVVPPNSDGGESYFGIIDPAGFTTVGMNQLNATDSHWSVDDVAYGGGPISVDPTVWSRVKARYR